MTGMHMIYSVANCNGRKAFAYVSREISWWKGAVLLFLCHSESTIVSNLILRRAQHGCGRNKQFGHFLQKKAFSKTWSAILQQAHELYPERLISPNLMSGGLYKTMNCILFIYSAIYFHSFEPTNYNKHMEFAPRFLWENAADRNFTASVRFIDEPISPEGVMNAHNLHTWTDRVYMHERMPYNANLHLMRGLAS